MTQKSKSSKVVTLILMILAMNTIYMLAIPDVYILYTITGGYGSYWKRC